MDVLVLFSGLSLKTQLSELSRKEKEKGRKTFQQIVVVDQEGSLSKEDFPDFDERIPLVSGSSKSFKTDPFAYYFFCVEGGDRITIANLIGFLERSNNHWMAFENVFEVFADSPARF
ncbi:MAG: hypothetical protein ACLFSL_05045 [Candidatus Woesearchaeota archaeon]